MFKCITCKKEFESQRALNAHQVAHKDGKRYSVSRSTGNVKTFICSWCGTEKRCKGSSYKNKYCSNSCQRADVTEKKKLAWLNEGKDWSGKKEYLLTEVGRKCEECGQGEVWNGKPLTLQLDHIDGDSDNNRRDNLRILCPHCHTQTETYGNAGKGSRYKKNTKRNRYLQEYKR